MEPCLVGRSLLSIPNTPFCRSCLGSLLQCGLNTSAVVFSFLDPTENLTTRHSGAHDLSQHVGRKFQRSPSLLLKRKTQEAKKRSHALQKARKWKEVDQKTTKMKAQG